MCLALQPSCGECYIPWDMWSHLVILGNKGRLWYDVEVVVLPHANRPQCLGWSVKADGQTPWEGAHMAALEVLLDICQEFGDELIAGPAELIP